MKLVEFQNGRILEVTAVGTLTDDDYRRFISEIERLAAIHGTVRVVFELAQFKGWDDRAVWDDLQFGPTHLPGVERLAVVGDKKWHHSIARFWKAVGAAEVYYFDTSDLETARAWIAENMSNTGAVNKQRASRQVRRQATKEL